MKKRIACLALTAAFIANCGVCFAQADKQDLSITGTDTDAEVLYTDVSDEVQVNQHFAGNELIDLQNEELINIAPEAVVLASGSDFEMNSGSAVNTWKYSPYWITDGEIISNDKAWNSAAKDTLKDCDDEDAQHYITFEWDKYQTISAVRLCSGNLGSAGKYIKDYAVEYWTGEAWSEIVRAQNETADVNGDNRYSELAFEPVEAYKIRLLIYASAASTNAIIHEAEVLAAATPGEAVFEGDESLLIHYAMDDETEYPISLSDSSGYHLHGDNYGGAKMDSTDSRFGIAGTVNNRSYITVPSNPKLDNQTQLTISTWIAETSKNFYIANKSANAEGACGYEFATIDNNPGKKLRFIVYRGGKKYTFESGVIEPDPSGKTDWIHVALTFDFVEENAMPMMYVNGKLLENVSAPQGGADGEYAGDTGAPLVIGNIVDRTGSARLKHYKIFNRILTEEEIAMNEFGVYASEDAEIISVEAKDSLIGTSAVEGYLDTSTGDYIIPTIGFPTITVNTSPGARYTLEPKKVTSLEEPVMVTVVAENLTTIETYTIRFTEFYGNEHFEFSNLKINGSKTENGEVKAAVDVKKRITGAVKPVILVLAVYSADGSLLEMKAKDIDGTTSTVETEAITLGKNASNCKVKAFVRDSWSGMRSLCPMVQK